MRSHLPASLRVSAAAAFVLSFTAGFEATAQPAGPIRAGFARVDITPETGSQIPGGFNRNISTGARDPLWAEAMVVMNPSLTLALVALDTLMVPDEVIAEARREIEARCGIPGGHVLIAATHTHSGGPGVDCLGSESDPAYRRRLATAAAEAVWAAHSRAEEARLGAGTGHEDSVVFNRRFHMKDGAVLTHPGRMNPDIVAPAGPTDPEVGVIAFENAAGELLGCVVNYALHATIVGGTLFSPDWPGCMRATIRGALGRDIGILFLAGASGDVTQVDNRSPGPAEFGETWGRRIGNIVGAEVLKVLARATFVPEAALATARETLHLPIRDLGESDEALVAREAPGAGLGASHNDIYLREAAMVRARKAQSADVPVEVQAMRIGNAAIVTNPTEFFCALGLAIKERSAWTPTLIATLANGYAGYVPTAEAFNQGGYEIRTARSSFLGPRAGERIVAASVRLLEQLHTP